MRSLDFDTKKFAFPLSYTSKHFSNVSLDGRLQGWIFRWMVNSSRERLTFCFHFSLFTLFFPNSRALLICWFDFLNSKNSRELYAKMNLSFFSVEFETNSRVSGGEYAVDFGGNMVVVASREVRQTVRWLRIPLLGSNNRKTCTNQPMTSTSEQVKMARMKIISLGHPSAMSSSCRHPNRKSLVKNITEL